MTDADVIAALRRILRSRPTTPTGDVVAADLARYDQIVGLLNRHATATPPTVTTLRTRKTQRIQTFDDGPGPGRTE